LDPYLTSHADNFSVQGAGVNSAASAHDPEERQPDGHSFVVEDVSNSAMKAQLLSHEGNMRLMLSTIDHLRLQNSELVQAASSAKHLQLESAMKQLASTRQELQEIRQQRAELSDAARVSAQETNELQSKFENLQSENASLRRSLECAELQCKSAESAAETSTAKLKVAADECRRLEHERDILQVDFDRLKKHLQAQVSRADEATAKCRQAEAEVEQLRHAMRLDADRMQVSMWRIAQCVSCDLPVLWRVCLVVRVCGRARVCVCAHLLFMGW
jgi:chromosome segregation ATPase